MAEDPETTSPSGRRDRRRSGWLPALVLVVLALLVIWLLRGYAFGPDVDPGDTTSRTTTIEAEKVVTPEPVVEQPQSEVEQERTNRVPDVVGLFESEAAEQLEAGGYRISVTRLSSISEPIGMVFEQTPGAYSDAEPGDTIEVLVSLGPAQAESAKVPDLLGMGVDDAEAKVESLGLVPRLMFQPKKESTGRVYEQSPAPGTRVEKDSKVFLLAGEMPGR